MTEDKIIEQATMLYQQFMDVLGIPVDANSKDTASRVARMMYYERCRALREEPPKLTVFPKDSYDEYIVVRDIPYFSVCAHHHVSFYGVAHIAYFPDVHIVGISKLARVVNYFSSKPQIQEAMTAEILDYLWMSLSPKGIIVKVEGEHLCMSSRGARAVGSKTVTQQFRGDIDKREVENLFK